MSQDIDEVVKNKPPEWTDAELEATVRAYREMERLRTEDRAYSKREFYLGLAEQFPRTPKAFEYRMQNISFVLHDAGQPWIPGLPPATNIGKRVRSKVEALLAKFPRMKANKPPQASYKAKLPAMRDWLIRVAQSRNVVVYGEVMEAFGIDRFSLRHAMDYLGHQAENADEPILTVIIVGKYTRRCGAGFEKEFEIIDEEDERIRLYEFWATHILSHTIEDDASIGARSARFASVEIRPDQTAFRRRVFEACGGKCVISCNDVVTVLDAAHRTGRSWRLGHNSGDDGYILRKDLHALYDAGLLKIDENGIVNIDSSIISQYGKYSDRKITTFPHC